MKAFFIDTTTPGIVRNFTLEEFLHAGDAVEIGTDASPRGLGGWYSVNGTITHYYHSPISSVDLAIFDLQRGSCIGQHLLEGLPILVALRAWQHLIDQHRVSLVVRGDNVGALSLLIKMRPSAAKQAIVARELALLTSQYAFPPDVQHTPGIAHKVADGLSRLDDPSHLGKGIFSHHALAHAERIAVPVRVREWYRALSIGAPLGTSSLESGGASVG